MCIPYSCKDKEFQNPSIAYVLALCKKENQQKPQYFLTMVNYDSYQNCKKQSSHVKYSLLEKKCNCEESKMDRQNTLE